MGVPRDCGEDDATPASHRLPVFQNCFEGDLQDTFSFGFTPAKLKHAHPQKKTVPEAISFPNLPK